ncbi:hypothetical protein [Halobacillus mangrovi]|uniref:Uncharacterized protein n=1 Tax=Halobacillus mangrovi TaxID=402384 RepID=A0A1W5ZX66_9BACI|nr:hypothetical protein [Halobacillus mangrovi]ARI77874.1 hypothetical protein HM131_13905 [Halobacillus mangrovi]
MIALVKGKKARILIYIMLLLIVLLGMGSYQYYQKVKKESRQFDIFLNHLYFSVDHSITKFNNILEKDPENGELDEALRFLEQDLIKTHTIIEDARDLLDYEIPNTYFFYEITYILNGYDIKDTTDTAPMSEVGKLDEKETQILETYRDHLLDAKEAMYSAETLQENPELSMNDVNEIIATYLTQSTEDIYRKSFR